MEHVENYGLRDLTSFEAANIDGGDRFMRDFGDLLGSIVGGICNAFTKHANDLMSAGNAPGALAYK